MSRTPGGVQKACSGKRKAHKHKKNPRDTGRMSTGHPTRPDVPGTPGGTHRGLPAPASQGFPVGSWMSAPKALFFQGFEGLPEVFVGCFSGWPRNRTGTGNRNSRNRFSRNRKRNRQNRFPGTETGTGTVLSCETVLKHRKIPFYRATEPEPKAGTARTVPPQTATEPNRTGVSLFFFRS